MKRDAATIIDEAAAQCVEYLGEILTDKRYVNKEAEIAKLFKDYDDYLDDNIDKRATDAQSIYDRRRRAAEAIMAALEALEARENVTDPQLQRKANTLPQIDILKAVSIAEEGLMAQVVKRDGETAAKAFARKFESDLDFRKSWRDLNEAKQFVYLKSVGTPSMMRTEPAVTTGTDALAVNDPVKALAAYEALVDEQMKRAGSNRSRAYQAVNENPDPVTRGIVLRAFGRSSPSYAALEQ